MGGPAESLNFVVLCSALSPDFQCLMANIGQAKFSVDSLTTSYMYVYGLVICQNGVLLDNELHYLLTRVPVSHCRGGDILSKENSDLSLTYNVFNVIKLPSSNFRSYCGQILIQHYISY